MTSNLATLLPLFLVMGNVFAIITCPYTHQFQPIPNRRVGAYCTWEVKLNTVYNRIPQTITEIICSSQHEMCGGQTNYKVGEFFKKLGNNFWEISTFSLLSTEKSKDLEVEV